MKRKCVTTRQSAESDSDETPFDPGSLFGSMFKKNDDIRVDGNKIFFHKPVNTENCLSLIFTVNQTIKNLKNAADFMGLSEYQPIYIFINSEGGDYYAGMSAYDHIKSIDYPIYTVIDGMTASAGTFISLAGKKRFIMRSGWVLIHQIKTWMAGFTTFEDLKDEVENSTNIMKNLREMYNENTNIPKKRLDAFFKRDIYIDSAEAIKLGIVDGFYPVEPDSNKKAKR